jgi:hypothetical protein
MADVEFDDSMFRPANERTPGEGADPNGNMRPMMDLGEVDKHNDKITGITKPTYGAGPQPGKPVLDPSPNFAAYQMNPNTASPAERRVVVEVTDQDVRDAADELVQETGGPETLER